MKKILIATVLYAGIAGVFETSAEFMNLASADPRVKDLKIELTGDSLRVDMTLDLRDVRLKSDRQTTVTPIISAHAISRMDATGEYVELPSVTVAGHNRYYQNLRKHRQAQGDILTRDGKEIHYSASVAYRPWMDYAQISLGEDECGCGFSIIESKPAKKVAMIDLRVPVFNPPTAYVTPRVETHKSRSSKGSAYIDFPVNKTEIYPDYRRNPHELKAITDTINMIGSDPDNSIRRLEIIGYASPEGSYDNNSRLAQGRVNTLAQYVRNLSPVVSGNVITKSIPEDWEGFRNAVALSAISDKDAILAIIDDSTISQDAREARLRKKFPEQFRYFTDNIFPALRHSDYTIEYMVKSYSDPEKIREVFRTSPSKLSLHELYVLAMSIPEDSSEYQEVFETAVRLYPSDPTANLNAGITALRTRAINRASGYLAKAGDSPQATYSRGVLAVYEKDFTKATELLKTARSQGVPQADEALKMLDNYLQILRNRGELPTNRQK